MAYASGSDTIIELSVDILASGRWNDAYTVGNVDHRVIEAYIVSILEDGDWIMDVRRHVLSKRS